MKTTALELIMSASVEHKDGEDETKSRDRGHETRGGRTRRRKPLSDSRLEKLLLADFEADRTSAEEKFFPYLTGSVASKGNNTKGMTALPCDDRG